MMVVQSVASVQDLVFVNGPETEPERKKNTNKKIFISFFLGFEEPPCFLRSSGVFSWTRERSTFGYIRTSDD
jgi:hypothetical protein